MPARLRQIIAIDKNMKNALRLYSQVKPIKKVSMMTDTPIAIAIPNKTEFIRLLFFIIVENYSRLLCLCSESLRGNKKLIFSYNFSTYTLLFSYGVELFYHLLFYNHLQLPT